MGATCRVEFSDGRVEHPAVAPDRMVRMGGVLVPPRLTLTLAPTDAGDPAIVAEFVVVDGTPHCREVRVSVSQRRPGLRQADLAEFNVADWTEHVFALVAHRIVSVERGEMVLDTAEQSSARRAVERARRRRPPRKLTPEYLQRVADIYRDNIADRPTTAVSEQLEVNYRSALDYVQRARRAGLLPPTTPGRKDA